MSERARKYRYFILVSGSHHAIEHFEHFLPLKCFGFLRGGGGGGGEGGKHNEIIQIDTHRKSLKNNKK